MVFYTTMSRDGINYAYLYRTKKELVSVATDGVLMREKYTNIQHNKTNKGRKEIKQYFIDNNVQFSETYKSTDYVYKDYDFCLPVIGQEYLFKPMLY